MRFLAVNVGDTEVDQFDAAVRQDKNIRRLDVAVHHLVPGVGGVESVDALLHDQARDIPGGAARVAGHPFFQGHAVEVFHDHAAPERTPFVLDFHRADFVDDVRVVEGEQDVDLAAKAAFGFRVVVDGLEQLDRHEASVAPVARLVNDGLASVGNFLQQFVGAGAALG